MTNQNEAYGVVYFVGARDGGPVKIGFTSDTTVTSRLAQLQTASHEELVVLGHIEGGPPVERAIHALLSTHLVRGEWFDRAPALATLARINSRSPRASGDFAARLWKAAAVFHGDDRGRDALAHKVATDLVLDTARDMANINTDAPLPFRSWLHQQLGRDDPTGDLANDYSSHINLPAMGNLESYLAFFATQDGRPYVTRAVIEAWIECDMAISTIHVT